MPLVVPAWVYDRLAEEGRDMSGYAKQLPMPEPERETTVRFTNRAARRAAARRSRS